MNEPKPKERASVKDYQYDMRLKNAMHLVKSIGFVFFSSLIGSVILGFFAYQIFKVLICHNILSKSSIDYYIGASGSIIGSVIAVVFSFISVYIKDQQDVKHRRYNFLMDLADIAYNVKTDSLKLNYEFESNQYSNSKLLLFRLVIEGKELRKNLVRLANIDNSLYIISPSKRYKTELYGLESGLKNFDSNINNKFAMSNLSSIVNKFMLYSVSLDIAINDLTKVYK